MLLLFLLLANENVNPAVGLDAGREIWHQLKPSPSMDLAVVACGKALLDRPYLGATLEGDGPEALVINFQAFDCVTFIETALAMALCLQQPQPSFDAFPEYLTRIRYRSGQIDGYASRLHYTSEWAWDNQQKGYLRDVTRDLGGVLLDKKINFMSSHADLYPRLAQPKILAQVQTMEQQLNGRPHYYLPIDRVAAAEALIQNGDLIGITTRIAGLDISHTGIAVREGRIHLLHASLKQERVVVTAEPLAEFLKTVPKASGIKIFRPQEVAP